ncbi:hypothetical protein IYR97_23225 (plasmid) [Pseudomonas fulva]|uniref:Uncharacterized protein n=3 Tax=Pseudomonas TaxID=286 RepID=A0A1X0ZMN3_PSEPU|nr:MULTISPECIES: hypothetical protein [Pseudomonas]MCT8163977.1 hypothetical protein [Pseudomonas sp. HD6422]MCT8183035.1 hypothetical protein [Pseudomonas sp. HD6421]MDH1930521.1 hypothetical protein [Pseudomonas sp. GD03696]MDM1711694.1 hypothetical protein [Pseudomonas sp. 165]ORL48649.1 hypothetical protein B7H18_26185 [Pseudomonas putida]
MNKTTNLSIYADSPQARANDDRLTPPQTTPVLSQEEDEAGWAEFTRLTQESRERDKQRSKATVQMGLRKLEACLGNPHLKAEGK